MIIGIMLFLFLPYQAFILLDNREQELRQIRDGALITRQMKGKKRLDEIYSKYKKLIQDDGLKKAVMTCILPPDPNDPNDSHIETDSDYKKMRKIRKHTKGMPYNNDSMKLTEAEFLEIERIKDRALTEHMKIYYDKPKEQVSLYKSNKLLIRY